MTKGGDLARLSVVVVTRDRCIPLAACLAHLSALPGRPPVIVVDNGSTDGTVDMVRSRYPAVTLLPLGRNRGSVARNLGVAVATTDLVAFADDDSWWEPSSVERAWRLFDANPTLGLAAARILVGVEERLDPTCVEMAEALLGCDTQGHPRVLGFVACGAVVRRQAFIEAGGFDDLIFFLGEESTLALDMAAKGWDLVYAPELVAHHHPGTVARQVGARLRRQTRNGLLAAALHRPWASVAAHGRSLARQAWADPDVALGMGQALVRLPRAVGRRRRVPSSLEGALRRLESASVARHR